MKKILLCYGDFFSDTGFALRIKNELDLLDKTVTEDFFLISFASNVYHYPFSSKIKKSFLTLKRHTVQLFFIIDLVKAILTIRKISKKDNGPVLLYAHSLYSTFIAIFFKLLKKNVKVVFDVHGVVPQEFVWLNKGRRSGVAYFTLKIMELFCAKKSDCLIFASSALKDYFKVKYRIEKKIAVIPNISVFPKRDLKELDRLKASLKKQFNLEDSLVLLHLGSFLQWTNFEKTIEIFKKLREFFSKVFLLIVTYEDKNKISSYLLKNQIFDSEFLVTRVPHDKIPQFAPIGDFGLVIRDDSLINRVAFPTKFSEYLACGVPVFCSGGIKDLAHDVEKHRLGYVLTENLLNEHNLKHLSDEVNIEQMRKNCIAYFAKELVKVKTRFRGMYSELTSKMDL